MVAQPKNKYFFQHEIKIEKASADQNNNAKTKEITLTGN